MIGVPTGSPTYKGRLASDPGVEPAAGGCCTRASVFDFSCTECMAFFLTGQWEDSNFPLTFSSYYKRSERDGSVVGFLVAALLGVNSAGRRDLSCHAEKTLPVQLLAHVSVQRLVNVPTAFVFGRLRVLSSEFPVSRIERNVMGPGSISDGREETFQVCEREEC